MLKKTTLWIVCVLMLAGVLWAQDRGRGPRGPMRDGRQAWLTELEEAYKANNRDKLGELIKDMKERTSGMRQGMGRPGGPPPGYSGPRGPMGPGQAAEDSDFFPNTLMANSDTEKKILAVLDDLDRNQRRGNMNVPVLDGRLLRLLTETMGTKHVVEVGTSNGYSGIWLGLALQKTGGKLTTFEVDAHRASLARENFKKAGINQLVTLVEGDAHENVKKIKDQIDILFLDADKDGYLDYLNKLLPLVRPGGLVVGHNINRRAADPRYIEAITKNPALESLLVHGQVSITLKKR